MIDKMKDSNCMPDFSTLYRSIAKLDVDINNDIVAIRNKPKAVIIIMDATGIKQHNRGEWIR